MFEDHYIEWRKSRFNGIKKYIDLNFFKDKTLYEVGCGHGDNGTLFKNIGCNVTSSDARKEHIENAKIKNPQLNYELFDCDKDILLQKYDIILHWGVLYHLNEIEKHIENICNKCDYLLLETEVCDSYDDFNFVIKTNENGYDQAFNNTGSRYNEKYIEKLLSDNNFNYIMIKDPIINSSIHRYDWEITNSKSWEHGLRRYWISWNKNVISPLK
jgi:hypothetical protein